MPPAIKTEMPLTVLVFNALIINTHTQNDTSTLILILKSLIAHFTLMHTHSLKVSLMAHFDILTHNPVSPSHVLSKFEKQ